MKNTQIKFLLIVAIFIAYSQELKAQVSSYNFSQKQDTIQVLTGGNLFFHNRGNGAVYYGLPNATYGFYYSTNYIFSGIPIGFNFDFNGVSQNVFGINSKGYIVLGNASINMSVVPVTSPISGTSQSNIISALGGDIVATYDTKIRYAVLGTAPNRILAVQWENMARRYSSNVDSLTFQIRLHETSNKIEMIYSDLFIPKQGSDQYYEIGLKGINSNDFSVRKLDGTWNHSVSGQTKNTKCLLGKYNYPVAGMCFTFTPPNAPCAALSLTAVASTSSSTSAANRAVNLTLDSLTLGIASTIEWQSSPDSINWNTISGATLRNHSTTQDSSTFYRCKVNCGSNFGYSNILKIVQLDSLQVYCAESYSRYPDAINIGNVTISNLNSGLCIPALSQQLFHAYSDYSYLPTVKVARGANYELKVSEIFKNSYIKSSVTVFIDYNHDGNFNGLDEEIFLGKTKSNTDGYYLKNYLQIPDSALLGKTKMRIVLHDPNTQIPLGACEQTFNGETEDYLIDVNSSIACSGIPDTIKTSSLVTAVCSNVQFKLFLATPLSSGLIFQWYNSSDSLNWTAINGENKNTCLTTQSQRTFYKCLVKCQNLDSVFSIPFRIDVAPFYNCYCESKAINPSDFQIGNVLLNKLNYSSGNKVKLYTNNTTLVPTPLVRGGKYNFSIAQKNIIDNSGGATIKAFIDFDGNGVYGNNSNEIISFGNTSSSVFPDNTLSLVITIPDSAHLGITGMRLTLMQYNSFYPYACGSFNRGEVEDYLVSISSPDSCTAPVLAGLTVSQDSSVCSGHLAHLTLSGINYSPNYTYQWQTSADSITWINVPNSNLFSLNIIQTVRTFYRCKITCNGSDAFSIPTTVPFTSFLNCYCSSYPLFSDHTDIGNIQLAGYSYGKDTLAVNAYGDKAYSDFTDSLPAILLEKGGLYPMKVMVAKTRLSNISNRAFVYIDFNGNGIFETTENFISTSSSSPNTENLNIIVPSGNYTGNTRMRVILINSYNSPNIQSACNAYPHSSYFGETEDYLVNIVDPLPCQTLQHGNIVASNKSVCHSTAVNFSYLTSYQSKLKFHWQHSLDSISWVTIDSSRFPQFVDTVVSTGYYRCIAKCEIETDTSTTIKVELKTPIECYCASSFAYSGFVDIGNIKLAGFNYGSDTLASSPYVNNSYVNYTDSLPPIVLQKGGNYPLKIQAAKTGLFVYNTIASILIDYNQNGVFESNEKTSTGLFSTNFPYVANTNLFIPATALSGLTRMRIVLACAYGSMNGSPAACGVNFAYGETEDYMVNIILPLPCLPLQNNTISASTNNICPGKDFTLTSSSIVYQPLLKYIWQSSVNTIAWTNIDTSQVAYSVQRIDTALYFRSIAICQSETDTSNSTFISLIPFNQCYCSSSSKRPDRLDIGNFKIAGYSYGGDTLINPVTNNSYSNYFNSLPAIILEQGGSYSSKITAAKNANFNYPPNASIYFDFNHNGIFENNESFYVSTFTSSFPHFGATVITVPVNAQIGITRMRVVINACGNYLPGPPACGDNDYYGETEDYAVNIIPALPCQTMSQGVTSLDKNPACINTIANLIYSGNHGALIRYIWQRSTDSISWITLDTTSIATMPFNVTTQDYVRCIAYCQNERDTTAGVRINIQPFYNCYCNSSVQFPNYLDIGNISIAGYSYGADTALVNPMTMNTYSDLTALPPIVLERGGYYPIEVIGAKTQSFNYQPNASVYIDFNRNGVFDSSELFLINNFSSVFPYVGSTVIQVPQNAIVGITRMRVIINACGNYASGPPACGTNSYYGETEDYLVNIIPIIPCSTLVHGNLSVSKKEICPLEKFKIRYVGNPNQALFNYKWQSSNDSINWVQLPGTLYNQYSNTLSTTTYFRCIVTCGTFADTTEAVKLTQKHFTNCYCNSSATEMDYVDIGNIKIAGYSYGTDTLPFNPNARNEYNDYSKTMAPIILEKGGHYPCDLTHAYTSNYTLGTNARVYIDFNQNGSFETSESFSLYSNSAAFPFISSRIIDIPVNAIVGLTLMRVVLNSGQSLNNTNDGCGLYQYGETEDYAVNIINQLPCEPLVKGILKSKQTKLCPFQQIRLDYSGNDYHPQFSYFWQGSTNGIAWTNLSYGNIPIYNLIFSPSLATQYRCIATCGTYKDTSEVYIVQQNEFYHCYCRSSFATSLNQDIGNVTLSTLSNGNPLPLTNNLTALNAYSDFTGISPIDLTQGFIYPLSVTQINSGDFRRSKVKAYLDFNADGDFYDVGEEFFIGVTSDTVDEPGKVSANIVVPYDATPGITGMRIVLNEKYVNNSVFPCGTGFPWGETEDYLVSINTNSNCTTPNAGNAVVPISRYCLYDSVYVRLENNSALNGESYQWQSSSDSITWNNVGSKTAFSSKVIRLSSAQYFRCEVSCNNLTAVSSPVYVDLFPSSVCNYSSCSYLGGSECALNTKITNVVLEGTSLNNSDTACFKRNGSFFYTFPDKGNTTATIGRGRSYNLVVTTSKNSNVSVWVDYDHNSVFSFSEWKNITDSSTAGVADTVSLDIPIDAQIGKTRMRIRNRYGNNQNDLNDACTFFYSGETEDYILDIDILSNIKNESLHQDILVEPNPATDNIFVSFSNLNEDTQIKLINVQGQIVYSNIVKQVSGRYKKSIQVGSFAKGIYLLQLESNSKVITKKVILE
jgi:hypothetical protein